MIWTVRVLQLGWARGRGQGRVWPEEMKRAVEEVVEEKDKALGNGTSAVNLPSGVSYTTKEGEDKQKEKLVVAYYDVGPSTPPAPTPFPPLSLFLYLTRAPALTSTPSSAPTPGLAVDEADAKGRWKKRERERAGKGREKAKGEKKKRKGRGGGRPKVKETGRVRRSTAAPSACSFWLLGLGSPS